MLRISLVEKRHAVAVGNAFENTLDTSLLLDKSSRIVVVFLDGEVSEQSFHDTHIGVSCGNKAARLEKQLAKSRCGKEYRLTARVRTGDEEKAGFLVEIEIVVYDLLRGKVTLYKEKAVKIGNFS